MRFILKLIISLSIILFCSQIAKKVPALAGLIAVMPLTGLLVLLWIYWDNTQHPDLSVILSTYCKAAMLGIIPSILFFFAAWLCFKKQFNIWLVLCVSFAVWLAAAFIHQLIFILGKGKH